ncbi:hypothetical protein OAK02_04510 [Candidatus Nitrosopelagicus sp.]|nr:hypothetical protein [Candidatus Nitrosopelagicus sp.]
MMIKTKFFRSVLFALIVSIGIIPALSASSVAEEREIPESLKHLFACDETISLDKIVHGNNQVEESKNILISGKVNFEEGKAVNLGIKKGYPVIMWIYQVNTFPTDYRLVMSDGVHVADDHSFVFTIPEDKLEKGKFVAYIFYGIPKESMQESMLTGKAEFFIRMSSEEFQEQEYEIMRKYLGADDIKRLQLEKIKQSNSVNSHKFCSK